MTACGKCGQVHVTANGGPACTGHISKPIGDRPAGSPCRQSPIRGGTVCRRHGGALPVVIAAAQRRLEEAALVGRVGRLAAEAELDAADLHPLDGLLAAVTRSHTMVTVLARLVGELDAPYGPDHLGDLRDHPAVTQLHRWTDLHARACKLALDAGIDERRLRLAVADIDRLHQAVTAAISAAGLTAEQTAAFTTQLAAELRQLEGGGGSEDP